MTSLHILDCDGALSWSAHTLPVHFSLKIDAQGGEHNVITLEVDKVGDSTAALALLRWHGERRSPDHLTLVGRSPAGHDISAPAVWTRHVSFPGPMRIELTCFEVVVLFPFDAATPAQGSEQPDTNESTAGDLAAVAEYWVHGLTTTHSVAAEFDFGRVAICNGLVRVSLSSQEGGDPFEVADSGVERALAMLAFGLGTSLRWHTRQRMDAGRCECLLRTTPASAPSHHAPLHPHILREFVVGHADAFSTEALNRSGLDVAIRWSLARPAYDEQRFMAYMTALEHLADCFVASEDSGLLTHATFNRLKKRLTATIDEEQREADATLGSPDTPEQWAELRANLKFLNHGSLRRRTEKMLAHYGVPMESLSQWTEAIAIRNKLVHKGAVDDYETFYRLESLIRELVVRVVFSVVGYVGQYRSWLAGHEWRAFSSLARSA